MPSIFNRALFIGGLALLLAFAANPTLAQEAAPAPAPRDFTGPQTLQTSTAPNEGIQVHGRWTITISDPDGSVDSEHVFQNALVPQGTIILASLLAGGTSETWSIESPGGPFDDEILATASIEEAPGNTQILVLTATDTASSTTPISTVATELSFTFPGGGAAVGPFTSKTLDTPVPVEEGQSVSIRVEISFE